MSRETSIVVLRDTESEDAAFLCRGIETTLRYVGISYVELGHSEVDSDAFRRFRIALLPCTSRLSPGTFHSLKEFVRRGGKLLLGLTPCAELTSLLGLERLKIKASVRNEMVFAHNTLRGLPLRLFLSATQIALFKPGADARELAHWHALENMRAKDPAAYLTPHGALLTTAIPSAGDRVQFSENRVPLGRFIAALVHHFDPEFDLLRFQRRLTGQLSDEDDLIHEATPRSFEIRALWRPHIPTPNECVLVARQNYNMLCPDLGAIASHHYERSTFHRPWPSADLLLQCADQAHRSGLELFPYVKAWPLPTPEVARFFDGTGRLLQISHSQSSVPGPQSFLWMCPTHPDNQQLLFDAITGLIDQFGLDGVVLAGLRFPCESSCLCDGCRQRFQDAIGEEIPGWPELAQWRTPWLAWRQNLLTDLLKRLLTACRATNPNAKLAIATLPSWDRIPNEFGQDPGLWSRQRLADIFIPFDHADSRIAVGSEVAHQLALGGGVRLCPALGVYSSVSELPSVAEVVRQIQTVRDCGADGFLLWHSEPRLFQDQFQASLNAGVLRSPAQLPWHPNAPDALHGEPAEKPRPALRHRADLPVADC